MGLIKFTHKRDYGHDWYVQLLNVRGWSLLQVSVSRNDYSWDKTLDDCLIFTKDTKKSKIYKEKIFL